ncbi:MAG: magnesium transporter [Gaiella sp.]
MVVDEHEPLAESAAAHLVTNVPRASADELVAATLARLRGEAFADLEAVYVVDAAGRLDGLVPLTTLLVAREDRPLRELMEAETPSVPAGADQELVATVAVDHGLTAVPVTDGEGVLLGVVPARALVEVLRREHEEDIHRLAGFTGSSEQARRALTEPPYRRMRHRLPWLLVGLLGSIVATAVVAGFEGALEEKVAIAFFVPGIVYLADAIGTQTEAIAVRSLSLGPLRLRQLLGPEMATGALIGLTLGAIALGGIVVVFGDVRLGLAVGVAIIAAGTIATSVGLLLPAVLQRLGFDPAFGSGPVATVIQDVLSLLAYFLTAELLLV